MSKKNINNNTKKQVHWLLKCLQPYKRLWYTYVIVSIISTLTGVLVAITSKNLIDSAVTHNTYSIIRWGVIFGVIIILQLLSKPLVSYIGVDLSQRMMNDQQFIFIEHILKSKWQNINQFHSGDLQTRITNDVNKLVQIWTQTIPTFLVLIFQFIAAFITLTVYDPSLAIFAFLITPVALFFSTFIGVKMKTIQKDIQGAESLYRSLVNEVVTHNKTIKAFEHETESSDMVRKQQLVRLNLAVKQAKFQIISQTILRSAYSLSFLGAFIWGAYRINMNALSFGTFTAFLQLVGQVQSPIDSITRIVPNFLKSLSSVERVLDILSLPLENSDLILISPSKSKENILISAKNLTFSYNDKDDVLRDFSLDILKNQETIIIGESGAGKTTFVRLLLSLITPTSGTLEYIDDERTQIISPATRALYSYVPQGDTLFSGTIKENLLIANKHATDEMLDEALYIAAADFISTLPLGLETRIGESNLGLSEGQAQRLTIARALLRQKPVLILDEATSALDPNTESTILSRIKDFRQNLTTITITHRPTIYERSNNVYEIRHGSIKKYLRS